MEGLCVGSVVAKYKTGQDGAFFDIDDNGAMLTILFNRPTEKEKLQFQQGGKFEIRFTELYGVLMITVKIGSLNWMDAPYSPHLSKNLTKIIQPEDGQGLALVLTLIDSSTGTVEYLRMVGLSTTFTQNLFATITKEKEKDFDRNEYDRVINRIYATYSTDAIAKMSSNYCKFYD